MKKLLLIPVLFFINSVSAQKVLTFKKVSDHSIHVRGSNFDGIVFTSDDFSWMGEKEGDTINKVNIYTPSKAEVLLAEKILYYQIKGVDKNHKYRNGLDIYDHWKIYKHQYIFYIDQNGRKYTYINCFNIDKDDRWSKTTSMLSEKLNIPRWYNDYIGAFDGGDDYWRARIDLQTKKIMEFNINGTPIGS